MKEIWEGEEEGEKRIKNERETRRRKEKRVRARGNIDVSRDEGIRRKGKTRKGADRQTDRQTDRHTPAPKVLKQ